MGKRSEQTKKWHRWQASPWKDVQHHWSLGKCRLKPQWDPSTQSLKWLKSETDNTASWWGERLEIVSIVKWNNRFPFWQLFRRAWWFLKTFNIHLPNNLAIPLLGIYPRETKIYVYTKNCGPMLIAALFIRAKNWSQSSNWWMDEQTVACPSMEYYSAIKRNELLICATTWMTL